MTTPAPQPAPLRPGQRAAKPKPAKALTPRQRECLELLAKPEAYARITSAGAFVFGASEVLGGILKVRAMTLRSLGWNGWASFAYEDGTYTATRHQITPASRAALQAGSGGGRGRKR